MLRGPIFLAAVRHDGSTTGELNRVYGGQHRPAPAAPVHQERSKQPREAQEETELTSRASQWVVFSGPQRRGIRNRRFPACTPLDLAQFPNDDTGERDGGEFDTLSSKSGQFNRKDKISVATWRTVNRRRFTLAKTVDNDKETWKGPEHHSKTKAWERTHSLLREVGRVMASFHLEQESKKTH